MLVLGFFWIFFSRFPPADEGTALQAMLRAAGGDSCSETSSFQGTREFCADVLSTTSRRIGWLGALLPRLHVRYIEPIGL
jgi:hypothetical protein